MGRNDQALLFISFFLLFAVGVQAQPPLLFHGSKHSVQIAREHDATLDRALIPENGQALGFLDSVHHYKTAETPLAAVRLLEKLREGKAPSTGWQVEIEGLKREAVILSWNLVAHPAAPPHLGALEIMGLRPTLFVPREGPIAIHRILTAQEVTSQSIRLENPAEYRFLQRPSLGLAPQLEEEERVAEGQFWILPGVVVLREQPDSGESESFTGTLSSSIPCDDAMVFPEGARFLLTYRVEGTAEQIELPAGKLRNVLATLGAMRRGRPIPETGIETLIADLRSGTDHPDYYLLARSHSRRDPLRVTALGESSPVTKTEAPLPIHPVPPTREAIVQSLTMRYLDWRQDRASEWKPELLFARFLAEAPGNESTYSEMLVAVERLRLKHGQALPLPPITAGEFEQLMALNTLQSSDPTAHPIMYQPKLTTNLRFRGGASASTHYEALFLNRPLRKKSDVLQVISQSATGRALLRKILPLIRTREFQLVDARAHQPTAASLDSVRGALSLSRSRPLGEAVPAALRLMILYLLDYRPLGLLPEVEIAGARRLTLLRQSYEATQRILEELVRIAPALRFYVSDLGVPPDVELIRDWGMTNARVQVENDRLRGYLRRCAKDLIDKSEIASE